MRERVAIVHDQLIQRGGSEGVVLAMHEAFPDAPIYTSVYRPELTYPEFRDLDVRPLMTDRFGLFRGDHRRALPLLAALFSSASVDADAVICSSAGWAHAVRTSGHKLVYCYTPSRWLYNFADVRSDLDGLSRRAAHLASPAFRRWDRWAASSADVYLATSAAVQERIQAVYGRSAPVLHPPRRLDVAGPRRPVSGLGSGFFLTVSRLQTYKNITAVLDVARQLPEERFVVAGDGPLLAQLEQQRPENVVLLGSVDDAVIRWLYEECDFLLAPAYEDFGLTPIEAAAFGKPAVALGWGGHRETVVEGTTGVFFAQPEADHMAAAIRRARCRSWDRRVIIDRAETFSAERFHARLIAYVENLESNVAVPRRST